MAYVSPLFTMETACTFAHIDLSQFVADCGDTLAQKSAACELKGIQAYLSCELPDLHVPLQATVDYCGHRQVLFCISRSPCICYRRVLLLVLAARKLCLQALPATIIWPGLRPRRVTRLRVAQHMLSVVKESINLRFLHICFSYAPALSLF